MFERNLCSYTVGHLKQSSYDRLVWGDKFIDLLTDNLQSTSRQDVFGGMVNTAKLRQGAKSCPLFPWMTNCSHNPIKTAGQVLLISMSIFGYKLIQMYATTTHANIAHALNSFLFPDIQSQNSP